MRLKQDPEEWRQMCLSCPRPECVDCLAHKNIGSRGKKFEVFNESLTAREISDKYNTSTANIYNWIKKGILEDKIKEAKQCSISA